MRNINRTLLTMIALAGLGLHAAAQSTAFTYQGRLNDGANPANGNYDLRFTIYDSSGGPGVAAGPLTNSPTALSNGLFTVTLDFGSGVFTGADRWLHIGVRTNGGGAFTTLASRQKLTPSPYALYAPNAGVATTAAGVAVDAVPTTGLQDSAVTSGKISDGTIAAVDVNAASFASTFWKADGNAGTTPGTHFLGTTDNQPLEMKVNGQRALRLEPNATSPNVIGGYAGNLLSNGFFGAFIGGGGDALFPNRIGGSYASVIGGRDNTASAVGATAAGNGNTASGVASIAMGSGNTAGGFASAAMGFHAQANHEGSFVWSDYVLGDFSSTAANQFLIRAGGGVAINNNHPNGAALRVNGFTALDGNLRVQSPGDVNNPQLFLSQTAAGDWSRIRLQSGGPAWDIALGPGANPVMSFYNGSSPVLLLEQDGDAWLNQNLIFQPGTLRQMVDLWNGEHAIGVQSWTTYFRTIGGATPGAFAWYRGGTHADGQYDAGGGEELMRLNASGLTVRGTFVNSSDRNAKENFAPVSPREVLEKVAAMPISRWNFIGDAATPHVGPMAQDFHAAFGLGTDERHIATVDADGVALAAIQGLNQKVTEELKQKATEITELRRELAELKSLLGKLSAKGN